MEGPEESPFESEADDARALLALERERADADAVTIDVIKARVVGELVVVGSEVVSGRVVVGSSDVVSIEENEVDVEVLSMVVVMTDTDDEVSDVLVSDVVSEVEVSSSSVDVVDVGVSRIVVRVRVEVARTMQGR